MQRTHYSLAFYRAFGFGSVLSMTAGGEPGEGPDAGGDDEGDGGDDSGDDEGDGSDD